jgi:8-oxo-dGTP pyrophosphatase MutT (NUDIX family)
MTDPEARPNEADTNPAVPDATAAYGATPMHAPAAASVPFPAATVILLRDSAVGPQVLMLERVARGSFAGMWVFPGGRVDPEDRRPDDGDDEVPAARRAAAREAFEETALTISPDELIVHSHWMPPPIEEKRFSTWFFVGAAPHGDVTLHEHEATHHQWIVPRQALDAHREGRLALAPPTWMTLQSLTGADSVAELLERAAATEAGIFHTRALRAKPWMVLAWRGDVGYELPLGTADLEAPGPRHRLHLDPEGWRLERDA